jgi:REP element-mobilizing transposase RayT
VARIHRLRQTDRTFFVTVNLRRRVEPFGSSEYPLMIEVLEGSRRRLGFLLCGYVLMPDHWHALIWTRYPLTISQVIHDIKKVSARRLHAKRGTAGPLWQHQFWDRFVRNAREFSERLEYMHLNPVGKGLVRHPEDWRWSSYSNFSLDPVTVRSCPIQIDYVRLPERYRG